MSTQNWFVLTAAQRTDAMAFNHPLASINPLPINNASPGVGINLNDNADGYDPGEVVPLSPVEGIPMYVAPKRIVDDPAYLANTPGMVAYLLTLPWCTLEDETIFAPFEV